MQSGQQNRQNYQNNQPQPQRGSRAEDMGRRDDQRTGSGRGSNDFRTDRGDFDRDLSNYGDREATFGERDNRRDSWPSGGYDAGVDSGYGRNLSQRDWDS